MSRIIRIFFDTEFTDAVNMDLISIGMKAETGEEFYGENLDFIQVWSNEWVKEIVYPLLDKYKFGMKRHELILAIENFINSFDCDAVEFLADWDGDIRILNMLLEEVQTTKYVFVSNLTNVFYRGVDEYIISVGENDKAYHLLRDKVLGDFHSLFDKYIFDNQVKPHHALTDARANFFAFNETVRVNAEINFKY